MINAYFPNCSMLVVQKLCFFRFFWRVWISAMWKLAISHWRVLISRRSGDPQFFGNEAKYDFFHNDGWKVFFLIAYSTTPAAQFFENLAHLLIWNVKWLGGFKKYQPKIKDPPDVSFGQANLLVMFEAGCFRRIDGLGATHAGARGFCLESLNSGKLRGMNPETW